MISSYKQSHLDLNFFFFLASQVILCFLTILMFMWEKYFASLEVGVFDFKMLMIFLFGGGGAAR